MDRLHENIEKEQFDTRHQVREQIDVLRKRVSLLSKKEKVMLTMYLENGNTFYQMAQLAGVTESTIARRIHRALGRLIDGQYMACLKNRDKLSEKELAIAKDYFLSGLSLKGVSKNQKRSYYNIRQTLKRIEKIINQSTKTKSGSRRY
jgi:DNA-directed RNA polymerase specialized sigma subunit